MTSLYGSVKTNQKFTTEITAGECCKYSWKKSNQLKVRSWLLFSSQTFHVHPNSKDRTTNCLGLNRGRNQIILEFMIVNRMAPILPSRNVSVNKQSRKLSYPYRPREEKITTLVIAKTIFTNAEKLLPFSKEGSHVSPTLYLNTHCVRSENN